MANIALTRKYSTIADYWTDVQTFMTSAGWTLHDDVDADNKVYKTNGSLGNYPYVYLKLTKSADRVTMMFYLYWNEVTHVGSVYASYHNSYNYCLYNSDYKMGLIGNDDVVAIINYSSTIASTGCIAGFFDKLFYSEITTTSGSVSTGTYVDLPVVSTAGFVVGQNIQIVGVDYEGRDQLTISDVQESSYITVENLPRNYASGAFVGVTPCPAGSTTYTVKKNLMLLCYRSAVGTANNLTSHYAILSPPISYTYIDPDQASGLYGLTPLCGLGYNSDHVVGWMDLDGLCKYSPAVVQDDVFAVIEGTNQPEQGAVTSGTSTTLYDAGKSWGVNAHADRNVVVVDGNAIGQSRKILSNTADTLTVVAWDINPSVSSIYRLCDKVYRYWNNNIVFLQDREVL
jgi:hypothetical protein